MNVVIYIMSICFNYDVPFVAEARAVNVPFEAEPRPVRPAPFLVPHALFEGLEKSLI